MTSDLFTHISNDKKPLKIYANAL